MKLKTTGHIPVLMSELTEALKVSELAHLQREPKKPKYVDATLGVGGHTIAILKIGGSVLGIDADAAMISRACANISEACPASSNDGSFKASLGNFSDIKRIVTVEELGLVDGILFDLGISSVHLDSDDRGFSFKDATQPLDMRLDIDGLSVTGADLLNALPEVKLIELFEGVLDYKNSRKLAKAVVAYRENSQIQLVGDFVGIVNSAGISRGKTVKVNPATKPMMALRMAVNSEMEVLEKALADSLSLLRQGGRLVVISFHSGEDRVVKRIFKKMVEDGDVQHINGVITPSEEEIRNNPRARSAKMRIIKKT